MMVLNRNNRKENIDIRCEAEYTTDTGTGIYGMLRKQRISQ
jgi:hypothetical protein